MAWTIELSALARKNLISVLIVFSSALPAFDRPDDLEPQGGTLAQHVSETAAYPDWFLSDRLDIRADLEAAIATGKRGLMVYFGQNHCVHCERFMRVNLADPDILAYLRHHFDLVPIDIQGRAEVRTLDGERLDEHTWARREQTDFTPSLLFYDAEGRLALRLRGYYPPYQFRAALEYVADGHYQRESFDDYLARGDERLVFDSEDLNDQPFFSPPPHVLDRRLPSARPLAVFFERGDCHACDLLHGQVRRAPEIQRGFEALDAVQLDRRSDTPVITPDGQRTTARAWADELGLQHAPALLFFDERGRELQRLDAVVDFYRLSEVLDDIHSHSDRTPGDSDSRALRQPEAP
ncbi:thioredoxin family protein [Allochromatium palmeri]|uniref:Thioredoxin fold domain-containing protein n=1 Tax=Allochromatium palmeri TaxID=231048 RepID=A0A6N8E6S3_9GAMM|nr:thioredoxin fold domain-containing protein [Allochromatium palmeri]MTW19913.1 thioredoxin fold domain-containing protein [Allochromatium palmeri]